MARPQVFISSTFYDLQHLRTSLEGFIERLGYEPVLSEKGKIAYDPDVPLDESCYRAAAAADIFVLIVGGRYGSAASDESIEGTRESHERYESITKKEYEAAVAKEIPTYILVDRAVYAEYETFQKNRGNDGIKYAQVDSVNVFRFLDDILSKRRNNPLYQFDKHTEIEAWLREQWAGLFREFINRRSQQKELATLNDRMAELKSINDSLQRYMEEVVSKVSPDTATEIISEEKDRRDEEKRLSDFAKRAWIASLVEFGSVDVNALAKVYQSSKSLKELFTEVEKCFGETGLVLLASWRNPSNLGLNVNEPRAALGLPPLEFDNAG